MEENMSNIISLSDLVEQEAEFFSLLSKDEEDSINAKEVEEHLPLLPLRNTVLFPGIIMPIHIGRDKSLKLVKDAFDSESKMIAVAAQKDVEVEEPLLDDLYATGVAARILRLFNMPDGNITAIIRGERRLHISELISTDPYLSAKVSLREYSSSKVGDTRLNALMDAVQDMAIRFIKISSMPSEAVFILKNISSHQYMLSFVANALNIEVETKQSILEIDNMHTKAHKVMEYLQTELQELELKNLIQKKTKKELDKQQRDYLLHQQLRTIQEELGDVPNNQTELEELQKKAANKKWSEEAAKTFEAEFKKLKRMNVQAAEYSVQLNYLETLVGLPWHHYTKDNLDLKRAQRILDQDHYGLEKVKERIIEYLAVVKLKGNLKSPIICLVGPPGVGKTSLGKSVARALKRKYIRVSLGGVRDESELRGHRKTYIGAMPGRIIQNLKKAGASNPVFVLDEIDKVSGNNVSGDPQAALLEILDPEQNTTFHDNYLEIDYDLSNIMFIATANNIASIHPALRDRMEIIDISGYLKEEKIEIASKHLVPKQLKEHGLTKSQLSFPKTVLKKIVEDYTRESGVRRLEKTIASIIRKRAKAIVMEEAYNVKLKVEDLETILGKAKFRRDRDLNNEVAGVVTGLAWTQVGGEILFIETSLSKGKGQMSITGNLGDVMKESATIAYQYLKAHSTDYNIDPQLFENYCLHIHIPEGATPKDGPSAGITMFTALVSLYTQRKVKAKIAMTGEITLRGKILPVGGIKEKILAAKAVGITDLYLSTSNKVDIEEIEEKYVQGLQFHFYDNMMDLVDAVLLKTKVKNAINFLG